MFSRSSRWFSAAKSVLGLSWRSPASASAWRTQLRRASWCTFSWSASRRNDGRGSDSRYSRTARSRSSSGYFFGAGNRAFLPGSQDQTRLRRLRRSGGTSKQEITEIGRLLAWLAEQDTTLATCTQSQLDRWLVDGPSTRYSVRTFVRWAVRRKLAPDLHVARRTTRSSPSITEQTRLDWLARCLRDEPETRTYRVAAVLLLLYAQPLVRIAALHRDQILSTVDGPAILLGNEPAALPSPFAELLLEHLTHRPNMQTGNTDNPWVFPSTQPGRHIRPNTMMIRLRSLGVDLRGARNTALKELVQRVPPPIVASQLGYNPGTTQRHAELASAPLDRYASLVGGLGQTSGRRSSADG